MIEHESKRTLSPPKKLKSNNATSSSSSGRGGTPLDGFTGGAADFGLCCAGDGAMLWSFCWHVSFIRIAFFSCRQQTRQHQRPASSKLDPKTAEVETRMREGQCRRAYQLAVHAAIFGGCSQKLVESIDCLLVPLTRPRWVCLLFHRRVHRFSSGLIHTKWVRHRCCEGTKQAAPSSDNPFRLVCRLSFYARARRPLQANPSSWCSPSNFSHGS